MLHWVGFGRIGVIVFFLISGYVIPFSFRGQHPARGFVISRFFRLYPAYWMSLGLAVLLSGGMATGMFLANLTMAPIVFGQPDAISVYWTLFIELGFYALCLMLFLAGILQQTRVLLAVTATLWSLAASAALLHWLGSPIQPPSGIPGYLGIMFLGTIWRRAQLEEDALARTAMP